MGESKRYGGNAFRKGMILRCRPYHNEREGRERKMLVGREARSCLASQLLPYPLSTLSPLCPEANAHVSRLFFSFCITSCFLLFTAHLGYLHTRALRICLVTSSGLSLTRARGKKRGSPGERRRKSEGMQMCSASQSSRNSA